VLAILGEGKQAATVDFEILGVKSGDFTFGHRAKSYRPQRVTGFKDYMRKLEQAHVEIDPAGRRQQIAAGRLRIEMGSLRLVPDEWLMDWALNSTEWPRAMLGNFDERFLHLPREILITVMRDHQKYFAMEDDRGNLRPHFVAVLNMDSDAKGLIREGHERVLAARFRDAEFFWKTDLKTTLFERTPLLDGITYQAGLGTYAEKVSRMKTIASGLCERLEAYPVAFVPWHCAGLPSGPSEQRVKVRFTGHDTRNILRAVDLCKCDLTTQMVQEFPELQGIVGGLYVAAQPSAESPEVAEAIYDHYRPASAEDACPRSIVGAVVSLADKLDSVAAGFAVGHQPTGSSDPFAIRRQANGVIKVLLELTLPIDLDLEFKHALEVLLQGGLSFDLRQVTDAIKEFTRERLTHYLEDVIGLRYDTVRAAMGASYGLVFEPLQVMARARAVERIRASDDFVSLSQSAKRIRNILYKSAKPSDYQGGSLDPQRLEAGPERGLYEAYERVRDQADQRRAGGDIYGALECVATLRSPVDAFFDKVLVMAEDPDVRRNRLQLLIALDRLFTEDADLSQIERPNVDASTLGGNKKDA
jgi:glycyl-tRNA synthetase beta chain